MYVMMFIRVNILNNHVYRVMEVCSFISRLKTYIFEMFKNVFPFLFMPNSHKDVYIPGVINQEGDMLGNSQAQG
jgi:hypothetical protein